MVERAGTPSIAFFSDKSRREILSILGVSTPAKRWLGSDFGAENFFWSSRAADESTVIFADFSAEA